MFVQPPRECGCTWSASNPAVAAHRPPIHPWCSHRPPARRSSSFLSSRVNRRTGSRLSGGWARECTSRTTRNIATAVTAAAVHGEAVTPAHRPRTTACQSEPKSTDESAGFLGTGGEGAGSDAMTTQASPRSVTRRGRERRSPCPHRATGISRGVAKDNPYRHPPLDGSPLFARFAAKAFRDLNAPGSVRDLRHLLRCRSGH